MKNLRHHMWILMLALTAFCIVSCSEELQEADCAQDHGRRRERAEQSGTGYACKVQRDAQPECAEYDLEYGFEPEVAQGEMRFAAFLSVPARHRHGYAEIVQFFAQPVERGDGDSLFAEEHHGNQ